MKENKIIAILAEDEETLSQIVKESLETRNFIVIPCKNGKEALETFYKEKADVLILDVKNVFAHTILQNCSFHIRECKD